MQSTVSFSRLDGTRFRGLAKYWTIGLNARGDARASAFAANAHTELRSNTTFSLDSISGAHESLNSVEHGFQVAFLKAEMAW